MRIFAALLILVLCAGCGKQPGKYGNFAKVESVDLIQDALGQMLASYPPARTHLTLLQDTPDMFGQSLVEAMRVNGYAVAEYAPPAKGKRNPAELDGLDFAYVLDAYSDTRELRITLYIGSESLSRLYAVQESHGEVTYAPIGYWARRQ